MELRWRRALKRLPLLAVLSRAVHEQARSGVHRKGEIELRNISRPVQVFVAGSLTRAGSFTAMPNSSLRLPSGDQGLSTRLSASAYSSLLRLVAARTAVNTRQMKF